MIWYFQGIVYVERQTFLKQKHLCLFVDKAKLKNTVPLCENKKRKQLTICIACYIFWSFWSENHHSLINFEYTSFMGCKITWHVSVFVCSISIMCWWLLITYLYLSPASLTVLLLCTGHIRACPTIHAVVTKYKYICLNELEHCIFVLCFLGELLE
jgi:hypothetical protein